MPKYFHSAAIALLSLVLLASHSLRAQDSGADQSEQSRYTSKTPSRDGTGKVYMGREISHVVGHGAIRWLERPERVKEEAPDLMVKKMNLKPDDIVADIGAGSGYFTFRIQPLLPQGEVIAVDIQDAMLEYIENRSKEGGFNNVKTHKGTPEDTQLPADSITVAFIVDAYHEFSHPWEMIRSIVKALKPGGRLILLEYRGEDPKVPIKPLHKMTEKQSIREMEAAGLKYKETLEFLPTQHFMVFVKPGK
jgi:ubiquinone/menaquinone biosynthesis C-methylase UbiE